MGFIDEIFEKTIFLIPNTLSGSKKSQIGGNRQNIGSNKNTSNGLNTPSHSLFGNNKDSEKRQRVIRDAKEATRFGNSDRYRIKTEVEKKKNIFDIY